jgi:hypothetical protein
MTVWPATAYSPNPASRGERTLSAAARVADNLGDNPLMATFGAQVTNRANRREYCSVDAGKLESIGCALGQQVRVRKVRINLRFTRLERSGGNDLQRLSG